MVRCVGCCCILLKPNIVHIVNLKIRALGTYEVSHNINFSSVTVTLVLFKKKYGPRYMPKFAITHHKVTLALCKVRIVLRPVSFAD